MRYLAIIIFIYSNLAQGKEEVVWRVLDWPPFYILEGQDQDNGLFDNMIQLIIEKMPEYDHKKIVMTTPRVES